MSKTTAHVKSFLQIGQLAQRSGVSAKALRLYEQRGLLTPCTHSESGYRLYGPNALRRLMQIVLLKRSGFSLAQIAGLLASATSVAGEVLGERIASLRSEIAQKTQALGTLETIARRVGSASTLDLDQLLESITMTNQAPLHTDDHRRDAIIARADRFAAALVPDRREDLQRAVEAKLDSLGEDGIEAIQRPWRELSAQIRAAMAAGKPAGDPEVNALAQRWHAYINGLQVKYPGLLARVRKTYSEHPELMVEQSMSPTLIGYMEQAMEAVGLRLA
jgi:DNA-binding transcriptional MerR regulator